MESEDSDSPPSQVFRSSKKRRVIKYDESHKVKVTPPTSGPNLDVSCHMNSTEADEVDREAESDNNEEELSSISSLSNLQPPVKSKTGKKRKLESSSSQAFLPTEKKSRQRVAWNQVATFETKEEYEQSDTFEKLK